MPAAVRRNLAIVGAVCGLVGLAGWAFYAMLFHATLGQDWMVFHTAARAYLDGELPLIFDAERFTALLNARYADWIGGALSLHPWIYPPSFLLMLLPFGLVSFAVGYALFLALGFAAALAATWHAAGEGRGWLHLGTLLLCPAAPFTVFVGQNAFLTSALLVGGMSLLSASPVLGGALLGVAAYKPQFWLMVPVALVAARQWRALASAFASAALLALLALAVFGVDAWRAWIDVATGASDFYQSWVVAGRLKGMSVYACAVLLGAPAAWASIAQGTAMVAAAAAVFWCYSRPLRGELRLAALLAATVLAAPHVSNSDALLLGIAATLLLSVALDDGFRPGEAIIIPMLWASPLLNPPSLFIIGALTPALTGIFIAGVIARGRDAERARSPGAALGLAPR